MLHDCGLTVYSKFGQACLIPYIRKYWRSLNLAICTRSGCTLILAEIKFGSCTARTKHSKYVGVCKFGDFDTDRQTAKLKMSIYGT